MTRAIISNQDKVNISKLDKCLKSKGPQMEDDFKIIIVDYICNYWSDLQQIWHFGLYFKWTWHLMENDLIRKISSKIERKISQQLMVGSSLNCNLGLFDQSKLYKCFKLRKPQMKKTSNGKCPLLLRVE